MRRAYRSASRQNPSRSCACARLISSVSLSAIDDTDTNPPYLVGVLCVVSASSAFSLLFNAENAEIRRVRREDQAWFLRFGVPTFATVDGEFVLGVAEFPATCCSEASPNILFSFLRRPRSAGVFFIS